MRVVELYILLKLHKKVNFRCQFIKFKCSSAKIFTDGTTLTNHNAATRHLTNDKRDGAGSTRARPAN